MKQKYKPLLKIVLTDLQDNVIAVLTDTIDNQSSFDCVLNCNVTKSHSDSISNLNIVLDNNNNVITNLVRNAKKIQVFVDYEDKRDSFNLYDDLAFFMGASGVLSTMINEVEQ